jgi:hypothetical protein
MTPASVQVVAGKAVGTPTALENRPKGAAL